MNCALNHDGKRLGPANDLVLFDTIRITVIAWDGLIRMVGSDILYENMTMVFLFKRNMMMIMSDY